MKQKFGSKGVKPLVMCMGIGLSLLATQPVQADLMNGDFQGTIGWMNPYNTPPGDTVWVGTGLTRVETSNLVQNPIVVPNTETYTPTQQGFATTAGGAPEPGVGIVDQDTLNTFFGLTTEAEDIDPPAFGSGFKQQFNASNGAGLYDLSFWWNSLSDTPALGSFFYVLNGQLEELLPTPSLPATVGNGYDMLDTQSGYRQYTIEDVSLSATNNTIGFGVFVNDVQFSDESGIGLIVDDVTFAPVETTATPEPGTWAMMGVGLAFLAFNLRRRRREGVALPTLA
jgi:hypothetical protein